MRPWRKIGLSARIRTPNALCTTLCQMLMLLVSSQWCLGGFTPNWAWGEESSTQTSENKASSSDEEYSFWRPSPDWSTRFFPTPQEIQRYRKSWNPFSHGPILTNAADVSPKGQFLAQLYVFSQVGNSQYGNSVTLGHHDSSVHLRAVAPLFSLGMASRITSRSMLRPNSCGTTPLKARGRRWPEDKDPDMPTISAWGTLRCF